MSEPHRTSLGTILDPDVPSYLLYPAPSGRYLWSTLPPEQVQQLSRPLPPLRPVTAQDWDSDITVDAHDTSSADDARLSSLRAESASRNSNRNPVPSATLVHVPGTRRDLPAELAEIDRRLPWLKHFDRYRRIEPRARANSQPIYPPPQTSGFAHANAAPPVAPLPLVPQANLSRDARQLAIIDAKARLFSRSGVSAPRTAVGAHDVPAREVGPCNPTGYKWAPGRKWKCPMKDCDAPPLSRPSVLTDHLQTVHHVTKELWVCDLCGMETISKGWFTSHRGLPCQENSKLRR